MTLPIRVMSPADVPAALELRFSTIENPMTAEQLERDYHATEETIAQSLSEGVRGWLCEDDGLAVGWVMAEGPTGELIVLAIRPSHEGLGIGKRLLTLACDWLFEQGHEEIWLGANPDPTIRAYGFYRYLGWRTNGKMQKDDEIMVLKRQDLVST